MLPIHRVCNHRAQHHTNLLLLLLITFLAPTATAANVTYDQVCTDQSVYTPFTKWPSSITLVDDGWGRDGACWWWAECVFDKASEVRKQQFAATALVMGLIPLVLKDIAWPGKRVVRMHKPLEWWVEVLVRALGLDPVVGGGHGAAASEGSRRKSQQRDMFTMVLLVIGLLVAYAALAVVEYFSKRSSLGCPYPIFVLTWFLVALIPAAIQVLVQRYHTYSKTPKDLLSSGWMELPESKSLRPQPHHPPSTTQPYRQPQQQHRDLDENDVVEAVTLNPVPEDHAGWVQAIWGIYYVIGTLVFTSIMAVTPIELFVWVIVTISTVAVSKMLSWRLSGGWR